jgi:hypothetical protein
MVPYGLALASALSLRQHGGDHFFAIRAKKDL